MVKNLPANTGDTGLIPGQERFPYTKGQLSLCATTMEAHKPRDHALEQEKHLQCRYYVTLEKKLGWRQKLLIYN